MSAKTLALLSEIRPSRAKIPIIVSYCSTTQADFFPPQQTIELAVHVIPTRFTSRSHSLKLT